MRTSAELENVVRDVMVSQDAVTALLILVTKHSRAEVVAATESEIRHDRDDLSRMLRNLADEVERGGGVPTGRHMQREIRP